MCSPWFSHTSPFDAGTRTQGKAGSKALKQLQEESQRKAAAQVPQVLSAPEAFNLRPASTQVSTQHQPAPASTSQHLRCEAGWRPNPSENERGVCGRILPFLASKHSRARYRACTA